ncbi:MAG TPA: hypothetical protein VEA16_21960 [Vicinamibacterales bacterium]|nr:hypothetical protein [Vicinamibacterales bacterium]
MIPSAEVWAGVRIMATHYGGAWLGLRCRLDLDETTHAGSAVAVVLLAVLLIALATSTDSALRMAGLLIAWCACWARALRWSEDRVIEWRGYSALAGVALVLAFVLPAPLVAVVIVGYATYAVRRAWWCRSELAFRRQAVRESPEKTRAHGNYGNALAAVGDLVGARGAYWRVMAEGTDIERTVARRNLDGLADVTTGARQWV